VGKKRIPLRSQVIFLRMYRGMGTKATIKGAVDLMKKTDYKAPLWLVYQMLNPSAPNFDSGFYEKFQAVNVAPIAEVEEQYQALVQRGDNPNHMLKMLERHHATKSRYAPPTQKVEVDKKETLTLETRRVWRLELQTKSQERFGGPRPAIDVGGAHVRSLPAVRGRAAPERGDDPDERREPSAGQDAEGEEEAIQEEVAVG
jgi:hypothetical protein